MNKTCPHAASGCDYPAGECAGHCASKRAKTIRLAEILEGHYFYSDTNEAAAELRRLHAENADYGSTIDYLTCENAGQIGEIVALKEQRDELLAALRMARENIDNSLQSMIETETHPVTGLIEHKGALLAIESEQDLLNQIDAAIAKAEGDAI